MIGISIEVRPKEVSIGVVALEHYPLDVPAEFGITCFGAADNKHTVIELGKQVEIRVTELLVIGCHAAREVVSAQHDNRHRPPAGLSLPRVIDRIHVEKEVVTLGHRPSGET